MSVEVKNHNKPRLKFLNNYSETVTSKSDFIPISIPTNDDEEAEILIDKAIKLKSKDLNYLKSWIKKYRHKLLQLWKEEITDRDFRNFMRKERKKDKIS